LRCRSAPHPPPRSFPTRRSSDLSPARSSRWAIAGTALGGRIRLSVSNGPTRSEFSCCTDGGGPIMARKQRDVLSVEWVKLELIRSEEHTSELQSRFDLVCRLLLE